ncbi:MAG TPA: hypothetical protein PL074_00285 [Thermoflexales bacterium]|nr:hypothetical protein [Thermoflexales bacterium]HQX74714.1 hypothetical protein [Thermoflexales bacterium]
MDANTTIPGGQYITADGVLRDANGRPLVVADETAKAVPVAAAEDKPKKPKK